MDNLNRVALLEAASTKPTLGPSQCTLLIHQDHHLIQYNNDLIEILSQGIFALSCYHLIIAISHLMESYCFGKEITRIGHSSVPRQDSSYINVNITN